MGKEPLTQKQFKELGYEQLHRELKKMLAQAQRMTVWFNAAERLNLLPALFAMKELVAQPGRREPDPSKPNLLGITPDVVRQWKSRTAAETDIRHLVGEEREMRGRRPIGPSAAQVTKHLMALTDAVLAGDDVKAEKLAAAFAEIYRV